MKKLILGAVDTGSVSIFSANHHKTHTHTHPHSYTDCADICVCCPSGTRYVRRTNTGPCLDLWVCGLTLAIGRERSQKGSKTVEQKPQWLQVNELFSCPTNRSGEAQIKEYIKETDEKVYLPFHFHLTTFCLCLVCARWIFTLVTNKTELQPIYSPTILLSSRSRYLLHIFFPFSSSLRGEYELEVRKCKPYMKCKAYTSCTYVMPEPPAGSW